MWHVWGRKGFWYENLNERDHLEDLVVDGRLILQCILKKKCGRAWNGLIWLVIGNLAGFCEPSNESFGSINFDQVPDYLKKSWLTYKYLLHVATYFIRHHS